MVSVSTKLATFPLSSMPLELKRVPARREDSREMTVSEAASLATFLRIGEKEEGMGSVRAYPRMTEVSKPD